MHHVRPPARATITYRALGALPATGSACSSGGKRRDGAFTGVDSSEENFVLSMPTR
ncbi:uncharacterized protein PHACADRAFT_260238 [Phanerochaete carnosa HHB-10118-sp]|uniref:Uncharacterized protein n=1 Tax=Phanerochaete carnosa (strain HHB-10118-sp) TaxID=650164 RepID=K5UUQ2_PHACS|nr:uncharacterized protein PHACADRAFT_260238 [Phanerochaete carnosa HHB-10118-sp]EKM53741.1 hypothetical protein PHACADRAFT_260238 [Phanerochaete carnosa HHB-10118-sp]